MAFKVEFDAATAIEWTTTADGAERSTTTEYTPSLYVDGPQRHLRSLAETLTTDPKVTATGFDRWYTGLRADERQPVLRVDLDRPREVRTLARQIRHRHEMDEHAPGTFRLYNVDLAPQFRYCLATDTDPVPNRSLTTFSIAIGEKALAAGDVSTLVIDGDRVEDTERRVLETLFDRVLAADPDVLVFSDAQLVPCVFETAQALDFDEFRLGREHGYQQLAGENTFESYGRVGHSPARYDVPGRVIIDRANSFLYSETTLTGLLDLVEHSWKPLQETAWASIGNVLTAIQIRAAIARDVLVPWNKWTPEQFKDVRTLHAADRGGFTFAPEVGVHDDVVEIDFSSLYPRIMVTRNISPDTILCECHADRADIPVIGYNVCDEAGFLTDVLAPILEHRAALKDRRRATDDPETAAQLAKRSNAFKWILVSCFGYQGYRNSKFGRIECHEAINAVARDILLTAKERCEANGWRIRHGIVDSLWVSPVEDTAASVSTLTREISDAVGIPLEVEARYDWVAFVPKRDAPTGALTKYFGKVADEDEYKVRGIEARQRSTPAYIEAAQRELITVLDSTADPAAVVSAARPFVEALRAGRVDTDRLVIRTRVSKPLAEYRQRTHTVAALRRGRHHGIEYRPGQDVRYVVTDDDADSLNRVRLHFEDATTYDAEYYVTQLVRAIESVVSPLGWRRADVRSALSERTDATIQAFSD